MSRPPSSKEDKKKGLSVSGTLVLARVKKHDGTEHGKITPVVEPIVDREGEVFKEWFKSVGLGRT